MLDFCGKHNIVADIEMINIRQINEAYAFAERRCEISVRHRYGDFKQRQWVSAKEMGTAVSCECGPARTYGERSGGLK
jgi:hypothetical protein